MAIMVWYVDGKHVEFGAEYEMALSQHGMLMENHITGSVTLTPWGRIDDITATDGELSGEHQSRVHADDVIRRLVKEV